MRRVEATKRLLVLIERVCAGGEFAEMVDAVYVFGSYARRALELGDVDLSISYTKTEEEQERFPRGGAPLA